MIETLEFETEAGAHDYMTARAESKGKRLAYGEGNNMSGPFYMREGSWRYIWYPDGIRGSIFRIGFGVRLSEYNPGFAQS